MSLNWVEQLLKRSVMAISSALERLAARTFSSSALILPTCLRVWRHCCRGSEGAASSSLLVVVFSRFVCFQTVVPGFPFAGFPSALQFLKWESLLWWFPVLEHRSSFLGCGSSFLGCVRIQYNYSKINAITAKHNEAFIRTLTTLRVREAGTACLRLVKSWEVAVDQ